MAEDEEEREEERLMRVAQKSRHFASGIWLILLS
jgi:hypothetical protein